MHDGVCMYVMPWLSVNMLTRVHGCRELLWYAADDVSFPFRLCVIGHGVLQ